MTDPVLLLIDMQRGFADSAYWGRRNNPGAEEGMLALAHRWQQEGRPIVLSRHDSVQPGSPLRPGQDGNLLRPELDGIRPELLVTKKVNSAFLGDADLNAWLKERGVTELVLAGIQTNMCVETTARMAGNLGYRTTVALDATFTFDLTGPDGSVIPAERLAEVTAANLHGGGFAAVRTVGNILGTA
ncbi:cysteine hydrolase [Amycolatopsis rhizosphaerae]|uniref:Cysteine hydrolase n=1 Tax=Amycolatopsis rhizosphaerae TaxID=2053003 RepID=A0A558D9H2_9PSEU|nr:cysteine hydrolase family protein [Amycolatopsis rhizosphaerae]TVT57677.1 cysteine hydrolase [Amycolatopsis rhizosphaerae]